MQIGSQAGGDLPTRLENREAMVAFEARNLARATTTPARTQDRTILYHGSTARQGTGKGRMRVDFLISKRIVG